MSDDTLREFLEIQALFRVPSVSLVEKDVHVVRAIRAVMSISLRLKWFDGTKRVHQMYGMDFALTQIFGE